MPQRYRFSFRPNLPPGARSNPDYPEHNLAFLFLQCIAGSPRNNEGYTSPSHFSATLETFPRFMRFAEEWGYEMSPHRDRPHTLGLRRSRRELRVCCGSLDYGRLERFDPSPDEDNAVTPTPTE